VCPNCESRFTRKSCLKVHQQKACPARIILPVNQQLIQQINKVMFKCNICQKEYKNTTDLHKHYKAKHGPPELRKTYVCPNCGYVFTRNSSLLTHLQTVCQDRIRPTVDENMQNKIQYLETKIATFERQINNIRRPTVPPYSPVFSNHSNQTPSHNICTLTNKIEQFLDNIEVVTDDEGNQTAQITNNIGLLTEKLSEMLNKIKIPTTHTSDDRTCQISKAIKKQLWDSYFGDFQHFPMCPLNCGTSLSPFNFEAGHIISRKNGGSDALVNLLPICGLCNRSMSFKNLDEYILQYDINMLYDIVIVHDDTEQYIHCEKVPLTSSTVDKESHI
jgi:transposase-like protein